MMKNAKLSQIKKTICISGVEFKKIIKNLFGNDVETEIALDGISIFNDDDMLEDGEVCEALAKYFDVDKVTSFHADDSENPVGIWVVYDDADIDDEHIFADDITGAIGQWLESDTSDVPTEAIRLLQQVYQICVDTL